MMKLRQVLIKYQRVSRWTEEARKESQGFACKSTRS